MSELIKPDYLEEEGTSSKEEIVIPKGIYSVKFFPKSQTNENQGNLKIEKFKDKPRQDQVYGTQNYPSPSSDLDMLDDDLNRL